MHKHTKKLVFVALALLIVACCGAPPPPPEPTPEPVPVDTGEAEPEPQPEPEPQVVVDPPIWMSAKQADKDCQAALDMAQKLRDEIAAVEGERTSENTLIPMNDMFTAVYNVHPLSELIGSVHPDKDTREAADKCYQAATKFLSAIDLDVELYSALTAVKTDGLDPMTKRFVDLRTRSYKLSGVDKDEATRNELAKLHEEMVKVGQKFDKAIREDQKELIFTKKELAGMEKDFFASRMTEDGKVKVTTAYPDFVPVAKYADNEKVRKDIYKAFLSRAYPANEATFKELLTLRHQYATKLGYENWSDYIVKDKMTKDAKTVAEFIDKVGDIARPRMEAERKQFLKRKKKDTKKAKKVRVWDRFYYQNKIRSEEYSVDSKEVRKYFDFPAVKEGLLAINQELFGVTFKKVETPVWHADVDAYDVYEGEEHIARFYLDMHPRKDKYGHAAMFPIYIGLNGKQLPSASLVCNFSEPNDKGPALMEHGDVVTFFHEFGHLMHHLLSGRHDWVTMGGIQCEWDFVEAPSQMLEEWPWTADVLAKFAKHYETGQVIPAELVAKMKTADEFGKGMHVMRQIYYAAMSYNYHARNPENMNLVKMVKEMQGKYSPYPYEKGTYVFANFGHLNGYSAIYYTYMWSLMLAKDILTKFDPKDMMNQETAKVYRDAILAPGGTVDAIDMTTNFLGRDYSFDAFKNYLEKE